MEKNKIKHNNFGILFLLLAIGWLMGCTADSTPATATPTPVTTTIAVPPTNTPRGETTSNEEAILILEPGLGSRVTSPIRVIGVADSTFEQHLGVRLLLADGIEMAQVSTQIAAEMGQRGNFTVDVPFETVGEQQAFLQVYATSPRDGGITHLSSVGLIITDAGPATIIPTAPHAEKIIISQPVTGDTIHGDVAHVEGFALASFEQTLLVEVLDVEGNVLASQPVTVVAPDLGQPGPFSLDISYHLAVTGPGRIVVRDISPAFGGDVHRASVEVTLEATE